MIDFNFDKYCYSCKACDAVCPTEAIRFNYLQKPIVDKNKCIDCHMCEKVCGFLNEKPYSKRIDAKGSFVCKNKDFQERVGSSSGGVFIELAKIALKKGWYVAGVVYDEEMMPKHIISNKLEDIMQMKGSKYVTSDLGDTLKIIKNLRAKDIPVLFTGTPCQVSSVANVFEHDEGILKVAIVCHGTIDRNIWRRYLREEEETNGKIVYASMREKGNGWLNYGLHFKYEDGSEKKTYKNQDGYLLNCFTQGMFERERCLNCKYKGSNISCDILLGDAWGMDKEYSSLEDGMGLSDVICLTNEGNDFFGLIGDSLDLCNASSESIIEKNQRIVSPAPLNIKRFVINWELKRDKHNVHEVCEKYYKHKLLDRLINKALRVVKRR
ncbi:Coenzyme F420 hydrogenase/dehydrogenase, beta subunit C-terminal domain [Butyrivibrio sp. XPD2002]|uniref:Coenzyme F420 hydrogenase/dehydrogenase, beta subunit C-terminal domain n=1 Tax=Butyrivibrio sp. XPD2002 TaxID=1280665 RepID=UPI0004163A7F|nr:Coenzyme F420 hydrogenase/dehydrogenase, beta subunit C-terminal domain [Butyrivibrio sp. XPD2002]